MRLIQNYKIWLCAIAVVIAGASLLISHQITQELADEERKRVQVWGEAMKSFLEASETTDLNLVLTILNNNTTIPVIVLDDTHKVLEFRNLSRETDTLTIQQEAQKMKSKGRFMTTPLAERELYICYGESINLKRLALYPYIQLGVVSLFVIVALLALLYSKRAEQNRVWVGLSKETAHQLGTPISALLAWSDMFRATYPDDPLFAEMGKDVSRLKLVADRFSKIGSIPELTSLNLCALIEEAVKYMQRRVPRCVTVSYICPHTSLYVSSSSELLQWVVENLIKNALDAIAEEGNITITLLQENEKAILLFSDTGKGIAKGDYKRIFKPGFTTKKRGWGLGLSLSKRIIEEYHRGKIYVRHSSLGQGTTFCIELQLAPPILSQHQTQS